MKLWVSSESCYFQGNYTQVKYDGKCDCYEEFIGPIEIEPIGFTIILFLAFILVVQTVGMFLHR